MKAIRKFIASAFLIFPFVFSVSSQGVSVKIRVVSTNEISVEGSFKDESIAPTNWSFLQEYADVTNLAERVRNLQLFDKHGATVDVKRFNAGEYVAQGKSKSFKYRVNLQPSTKITDLAHTSWLTENQGILMLGDLLPNFNSGNVWVDFDLPADFKISAPYPLLGKIAPTNFRVEDAVFLIGRNWREKQIRFGDKTIRVAIVGNWQFSDDEAVEMVREITAEYRQLFGELPVPLSQIILSPFPQENSNPDRWRAETRGSTVTIISGAFPFRSQQIQRLAEQLRHEIFHLWIPNSLALTGNYDWFYEGFSMYHALRTGVELNQIYFKDFLNILSKAYDLSESQTNSLIEASSKRWSGSGSFVYLKGMIVAFLCDLALLRASNGKRNLKDVFRQIYKRHRLTNQVQDGNLAILSVLRTFPELLPIVQSYIEGRSKISWEKDLKAFGIVSEKTDFGVQLAVSSNSDKRQKDLLDRLGYNQWRKILQKTR